MKTPWPEDIGRVARQRRLDLNLSQNDLADRTGVTRQWLSRFESAKADVSLSKVLLVLRELDLNVDVRAPQPTVMPDLASYAADSIMRTVAQINANMAGAMADSVQRAIRGAGISSTARAALEKLTFDPAYSQAMQGLQLDRIDPLSKDLPALPSPDAEESR
ncbi:helix-turn-helix domain-containing protein [Cryobacterium fucosi]|uniref:XRE family transcriptional regulator n=1 Tax=Cryobacterium fucosi TaxID=1259157 RepID=A0A4R9BFM2_9MICO|nr:helix-turn-helix transcriptional regulator [Cryobacterium fucosi]TFD83223.1 XRE family transcriptional regulator [Cryobacterium fucosi]